MSVAVVKSRMVVLGKPLSGQTGKEGACSHGRGVNGGGGVAAEGERHERCHGNGVVDPSEYQVFTYPSIEFHLGNTSPKKNVFFRAFIFDGRKRCTSCPKEGEG